MIRTKGEAGTGNVVEAVRHMRTIMGEIRKLVNLPTEELMTYAKEISAPYELVVQVAKEGKLPVVNFAAGGVATPSDAALMMHLGSEGVFVGSGIFKSSNPEKMARAIVKATTYYNNPEIIAEVSEDLGEAMYGLEISQIKPQEILSTGGGNFETNWRNAFRVVRENIDSLQGLNNVRPVEVKSPKDIEGIDVYYTGGESLQ
jgi:pyridoxal 5'-phosphate synthase pdxS subunit